MSVEYVDLEYVELHWDDEAEMLVCLDVAEE